MSSPLPVKRAKRLAAIQRAKMAKSPHAFMRASTKRFYDWLDASRARLPQGPDVWICGDCHVGNLGPVSDRHAHVTVEIRDLDQSVIGNPAHDVLRLALSLASHARSSDLPGAATVALLEALIDGYRQGLVHPSAHDLLVASRPKAIQTLLRHSLRRRWKDLALERLKDPHPSIPIGKRFWRLSARERGEIRALTQTEALRRLVTRFQHRDKEAPVELMDAAYWVKGLSSLGKLRYAVVLCVGEKRDSEFCLIDIKEAGPPAAPRSERELPGAPAARVLAGAAALSPSLGERMLEAKLLDKSVFVRELCPQDLKPDIGHMRAREVERLARYFAVVLGQAHGRQMSDRATRREWRRAVAGRASLPKWLWTATVELLATHEAAYLEHCAGMRESP